jgi:hypothetical protein
VVEKKPYVAPQVYQVELDHQQAILSACSLTATSASNGMMQWCRVLQCKSHGNMNMADSGARPS